MTDDKKDSGIVCGESIGLSFGGDVKGFSVSAGVNLPAGVNETCMTHTRATNIIGSGVEIYDVGQLAGAEPIAVGIGAMMQEGDAIENSVKHVAEMDCVGPNPLDSFTQKRKSLTSTPPVQSDSVAKSAFNAIKDKAPSVVVSAVAKCANFLKRTR
jgi:hypothetical protein